MWTFFLKCTSRMCLWILLILMNNFLYRDIKDSRILVKFIVSLDRQQGKGPASETLDVILAAHNHNPKIIVGVDLSGDPMKGLVTDYLPILACARNAGLKISIHCAEVCTYNIHTLELHTVYVKVMVRFHEIFRS